MISKYKKNLEKLDELIRKLREKEIGENNRAFKEELEKEQLKTPARLKYNR